MRRADLVADCGSCAGLCCIATSFEASEDFAIDKPAGVRCGHLTRSGRCAIHGELAVRGFRGCTIYDCYGAGPRTLRVIANLDRETAELAGDVREHAARNAVFAVLRVVHELLWLLTEAEPLCTRPDLAAERAAQVAALDAIAMSPVHVLLTLDLGPHELATRGVLERVGRALGRPRALAVLRSIHD